ncbi:hypothetical protein JCM10207_007234 [Rhodosporidiobolus poonsookiae]
MKTTALLSCVLSISISTALAASPQPQLYFAPSSLPLSSSSSSPPSPPSLSAPQANAALAHLLSVSHHTHLPLSTGRKSDDGWQRVLDEQVDPAQPRVVITLECGKQGCDDALPSEFTSSPSYYLPSLPTHSYLAALSLHLHRLADSLGLDADAPAVKGLKGFVDEGLKTVAGWQGWVGDELGSWIGWEPVENKLKPAVEPKLPSTGMFTDLDLLDSSATQLVLELEQLTALADSFSSASSKDSGAQGEGVAQITVVHLKGLKDLASTHGPTSPTYLRATALLRSTLSALYSSLSAQSPDAKFVLLALPPHPRALLRRRQGWLKPFAAPGAGGVRARNDARAVEGMNRNVRRSVFAPRQADDGEKDERRPVVPSSRRCFASLDELNNATASCLSRGQGVRGITTRGEEDCWVCQCAPTTEELEGGGVRRRWWGGEGCEKEDLSGSFTLLALSSLALVAALALSVALLYGVGSAPLPGTLGAVGGEGRMKRE